MREYVSAGKLKKALRKEYRRSRRRKEANDESGPKQYKGPINDVCRTANYLTSSMFAQSTFTFTLSGISLSIYIKNGVILTSSIRVGIMNSINITFF